MFPQEPKEGYGVKAKTSEMIRSFRAERIVSVIGGRLQQSGNGKTLIIDFRSNKDNLRLFTLLLKFTLRQGAIANGGSVGPTTFEDQIQAITNGNHYLVVEIEYDTSTGEITSRDVFWTTTPNEPTDGLAVAVIGGIQVVDEQIVVPPGGTFNLNYGPIVTFLYGGIDTKWNCLIV